MIKKQIIKADNKPIAVILDYSEYKKLKEMAEDREDYLDALKVKKSNKKWVSHDELKKKLGV